MTARKPWQQQMILCLQSVLAIYLATFCVSLFFMHHNEHWVMPAVLLGLAYAVVIVVSIKRLIQGLPMPVLMIAAPTVPLIILLLIITLFPIMRLF